MFSDSYYELYVTSYGKFVIYKQFDTYDEAMQFIRVNGYDEYSLYYCVVKEVERRVIHDKYNK